MIDWVFLDVGNVLLDEDPLAFLCFRRHWEAVRAVRPATTFLDLLARREAKAVRGSRWPLFEAVSEDLDESACARLWDATEREVRARFAELSPPIPGSFELVDRLASRFRLGLIANQGRECRERLEGLGLLDRFEVVALSEERGAFKPDLALFRWALNQAGIPAGKCLMVGDRLDNDVLPASSLGMETAWVRWPRRSAKGWRIDDPDALAFLHSLERSSALGRTPETRPTIIVDETRNLADALVMQDPPREP